MTILAIGRCFHLLDFETCARCNGSLDRKLSQEEGISKVREQKAERRARHLYMQETSKLFASKHMLPYSDEELEYIILNTRDTTRQDTEHFFNIAREVERRLGSIEWLWNYIWRENFDEVLPKGFDTPLYERIQNLKGKLELC